MTNYKFDYRHSSFKVTKNMGENHYYIKINNEYIEVSQEVFNTCKSSYNKIRYTYLQEVARSILYFEDIDSATFFVSSIEKDIVDEIYHKDLAQMIRYEIAHLDERNRKIAVCVFLNEMSERDTAALLNIPATTISYRKKAIREQIIKKIKKYLCR